MDYSSIFSLRANRYRDAQQAWPAIRQAELECFAAILDLQAGERLLDAPAGNGVLRRYLPAHCDYLALDPAADFAADCRAQGLAVVCSSLRATGLPGASIDVVGSLTGVHHESSRQELYAEWWRVLKPGGRLLVMDVASGSAVGGFLNGFVDRWNSQGHCGYFLDQADEQALQAAGFEKVERRVCEYEWCAEDHGQMCAYMLDLFGLDRQPDTALMAAELASGLNAGFSSGCYRVPWSLTALTARKPGVSI